MSSKTKMTPYQKQRAVIDPIIDLIEHCCAIKNLTDDDTKKLEAMCNSVEYDFLERRHISRVWQRMIDTVLAKKYDKASIIVGKIKRSIDSKVPNDLPFKPGDKVHVARTRHGWHDYQLTLTIKTRGENAKGTFSYIGTNDEGDEYIIDHTKDAVLSMER